MSSADIHISQPSVEERSKSSRRLSFALEFIQKTYRIEQQNWENKGVGLTTPRGNMLTKVTRV